MLAKNPFFVQEKEGSFWQQLYFEWKIIEKIIQKPKFQNEKPKYF
jgi:hypothetical protein